MSPSPRRLAALLVAGALVSGACSEDSAEQATENPKQAFSNALDALREYEGVTLVMTIEADPAELASAEDMTQEAAEAVVDSSLTISAKGGEGVDDAQVQLLLDIAGNDDAAELRLVDQSLYARVDVRGLVEEFGGNAAEIESAADALAAQGFDFARAAVNGDWVGVEGLGELAEQFAIPQPSADPEQAREVADQVIGILENNARVTSEGTDDVGAHLVVSVPLKDTARDLVEVGQALAGLPPGSVPTDELQDVPDADIPIDVWVEDDRLVQVEFDAVRIANELGEEPPEGVSEAALRMTIDEFTDEVEAPADFAPIDLQEILGSFFGGFSGSLEAPAGQSVPLQPDVSIEDLGFTCEQLAGLRPADIEAALAAQPGALKAVRKACPELFE